MSKQWKLDRKYAEIMENHPFGIALYRPLPYSTFKPGVCGYFDEFGAWNPICNLQETDSVKSKGLLPVNDELERAPVDDGITWGPKTSVDTNARKINLTAGVDPAIGVPVTVSAIYEYSTDKDVGAVLLTNPPVTHERFYHATPFKNWMKNNALTILQKWPEVKDHSLWIVTSTYASKKCAINMWSEKGRGFKVGFSAQALGLGQAGTGGEWHTSQQDEGWAEYTTPENDRSVVFFGGLLFQYHRRLNGQKELRPKTAEPVFRGVIPLSELAEEVITSIVGPDVDEFSYDVNCTEIQEEDDDFREDEW